MPAGTTFEAGGASLDVTAMSAQNAVLDGHSPTYGIGTGGNSTLFEVSGSTLKFKGAPEAGQYEANVTASGSDVFEDGNNWKVLEVTVTGESNSPSAVTAGSSGRAYEGSVGTLTGNATDDGGTLAYEWSHDGATDLGIAISDDASPDTTFRVGGEVEQDVDVTFTLTVTDPHGSEWTDTTTVTIQDSSGAFITTWRTAAGGKSVTFYASGSYDIDWGDGSSQNRTGNGPISHAYPDAGEHRVIIKGDLDFIQNNRHPYNLTPGKLLSIDQWGDIEWSSMNSAFEGATNMAYLASDTPNLSAVTDMTQMFWRAASFDGDLSRWDVSSVTDMKSMFRDTTSFHGDISTWNVSSVTKMRWMFYQASSFNADISGWDVSSVTEMQNMFRNATSFNADISGWDVSSVTKMHNMFEGATSFDRDISGWDVSSVTDT